MKADTSDEDFVENLHRQLDTTLDDASRAGKEIASKGRELASEGQSLTDWAEAVKDASKEISDPAYLRNLVYRWGIAGDTAQKLNSNLMHVAGHALSSTASLASAGTLWIGNVPAAGEITTAAKRIRDLAGKPEVYTSVAAFLRELCIDQAHGNFLSALQHFETAHSEYRINAASPNQATTWLIPIRECILAVLDSLLKRTIPQKKVSGVDKKVMHVLTVAAKVGYQQGHVENVANECKRLLDEGLSPSKHKALSRSEGESLLLAATMWLRAFLSMVDPGKLKKIHD